MKHSLVPMTIIAAAMLLATACSRSSDNGLTRDPEETEHPGQPGTSSHVLPDTVRIHHTGQEPPVTVHQGATDSTVTTIGTVTTIASDGSQAVSLPCLTGVTLIDLSGYH